MNVVRANPVRLRSSRKNPEGGSLVPIAIVAGTAIVVFGVVYYLGRRRQVATTQQQRPSSSIQLPPGAVALNEFGYPVGYDGTPMLSANWHWPPIGTPVGYNSSGQLIDSTGSPMSSAGTPSTGSQPLPVATSVSSQMPPA